MEDVLANLLLEDAAIKDLVTDRVDWDELPQGLPRPAIVMHLISAPVSYHLQGPSKLVPRRVQFDCWGDTKAQAKTVSAALGARLSGFRGDYAGVRFGGAFKQSERSRSDKNGANGWFTASSDYIIWSKPA